MHFVIHTFDKRHFYSAGIHVSLQQLNPDRMSEVELIMPKMGESIMEATILAWVKQVGDDVKEDETILEIATDKVDSEIPSPVSGKLVKILYEVNDVVDIGKVIAIIQTDQPIAEETPASQSNSDQEEPTPQASHAKPQISQTPTPVPFIPTQPQAQPAQAQTKPSLHSVKESGRFYSPLVRNIASQNGLSIAQLDSIPGSGSNGRVTKQDILQFLKPSPATNGHHTILNPAAHVDQVVSNKIKAAHTSPPLIPMSGDDEIIVMDRMRRLIADHMVMSKQTSPHVTSFIEVDVTDLVLWRNGIKNSFQQKYGQKITFTPIFIQAVVKAIHDFPMVNVSVDGDKIIKKNRINIGLATAMNSGNLIVPVIKKADQHSLLGLTQQVNDLAFRARNNKLKADEVQDGTFTVTNVGTFGNVMGTPIINQPQVAILAVGAIRKKPAVIETDKGDFIGIRHMMFMSLSYDHRVVDGLLGGSFLRRVADYLEAFDATQNI